MRIAVVLAWLGAGSAVVIGVLTFGVIGLAAAAPDTFGHGARIPTAAAWATVAIGAIACVGAFLTRRRPGIAGIVMASAALALMGSAGALSLLPSPLLFIAAVIAFRHLPPA